LFAFAFGYDWGKGTEEGKKSQYPVRLFIRKVKEEEAYKKSTNTINQFSNLNSKDGASNVFNQKNNLN
jgi:hypothetical protein